MSATTKVYTYLALLLASSKHVVIDHLVRYNRDWRVGWRPHERMTAKISWIDSAQPQQCRRAMTYARRKGARADRWWPGLAK